MQYFPNAAHAKTMSSEELRSTFLLSGLFTPGQLTLRVTDLDRAVIGGVVPLGKPVTLDAPEALRAEHFTERREVGVLNIGGDGSVNAGGKRYDLQAKDVLYIGRGTRDISFESRDRSNPARFYIISYPSHAEHPPEIVTSGKASMSELGTMERANKRRIYRYIHADGVKSGQLVMGVTVLEPGSVWNTMPAHTHARRTEVYLYFDLPADSVVVHLMGEPNELRPLIVRDGEVALSPGWSVHTGCGTTNYSFCWAMGGENQDYADMQPVQMETLR